MKKETPARELKCAIYTRKSTEEGLEQEFNTLDAQRESAECYIKSQEAEGWICLPDHYDDGGYTGGNMDRPALKRLLADIEAGKVDCIVVYKVDRLSRSLMDFARMLEVFERKSIAFVSVTQQFNTTNSMGRLMLNVLLSFAQFEREIISERTRDKMAAARRKGKWVGGLAPMGYDIDPFARRLNVNEDEAARVRTIYELYLECGSIVTTLKEIERRDWRNKLSITKKGKERGGRYFDKSSLFKLLTNLTYLGKIRYKEEIHQITKGLLGQQEAEVAMFSFDAVWESMTLRDQIRLIGLVVKQVDYDGESGRVTITFNPIGIRNRAQHATKDLTEVPA